MSRCVKHGVQVVLLLVLWLVVTEGLSLWTVSSFLAVIVVVVRLLLPAETPFGVLLQMGISLLACSVRE